MKKNMLAIIAILAIALLTTSCAQTVTATSDDQVRTLDVTGTGLIELDPDIARVNIGVRSQSPDVAEALAENSAIAEAIMGSLMALGIEEGDIQTRNFNIYPQQDQRPRPQEEPEEPEEPTETFVVENTVAVVVRELDTLGDVLASAVEQGANTIHGVSFDVEDREGALEEARVLAIEDAQAQAQAIAETAGVNLGEIQSINISRNGAAPQVEYAMDQAVGGGVPIAEGTLSIQMTVNITYRIN